RIPLVRPSAADPVNHLRHVDHLEVRRERANEVTRRARREGAEQSPELREGLAVALAALDRGAPRRLDEIEERLAALLAHELADELAEPVHVLAKRLVLFGEEDVGPTGGSRSHGTSRC